jgi:hypothetical protein
VLIFRWSIQGFNLKPKLFQKIEQESATNVYPQFPILHSVVRRDDTLLIFVTNYTAQS